MSNKEIIKMDFMIWHQVVWKISKLFGEIPQKKNRNSKVGLLAVVSRDKVFLDLIKSHNLLFKFFINHTTLDFPGGC